MKIFNKKYIYTVLTAFLRGLLDLRPDEMKAIIPSNLSEQNNSLAGGKF